MGKGSCVNFTLRDLNDTSVEGCLCQDSWTGRGDFIDASFLDCSTLEPLIHYWYIVHIPLFTALMLYAAHVCRGIKGKKSLKRAFKARKFKTAIMIVIFSGFKLLEATFRVSTEGFVGEHTGVTIMNFLSGAMFWAFIAPHFFIAWMKLIQGTSKSKSAEARRKNKALAKRTQQLAIPASIIAMLSFSMVPLTLAVNDLKTQLIFMKIYYVGCTILSAYFIYVVLLPAGKVIKKDLWGTLDGKDLKNLSPGDARIKVLFDRIKIFVREVGNAGVTNTASALVFAVIP